MMSEAAPAKALTQAIGTLRRPEASEQGVLTPDHLNREPKPLKTPPASCSPASMPRPTRLSWNSPDTHSLKMSAVQNTRAYRPLTNGALYYGLRLAQPAGYLAS